jgi:hypothetical protein
MAVHAFYSPFRKYVLASHISRFKSSPHRLRNAAAASMIPTGVMFTDCNGVCASPGLSLCELFRCFRSFFSPV